MAESMEPLFKAIMGMPKPIVKETAPLQVNYGFVPRHCLLHSLYDCNRQLVAVFSSTVWRNTCKHIHEGRASSCTVFPHHCETFRFGIFHDITHAIFEGSGGQHRLRRLQREAGSWACTFRFFEEGPDSGSWSSRRRGQNWQGCRALRVRQPWPHGKNIAPLLAILINTTLVKSVGDDNVGLFSTEQLELHFCGATRN